MLKRCLLSSLAIALIAANSGAWAHASGALTGATEFTQILNNAELIALGGQNAEQIANQVQQISNQVEQIANQIRIYENMLQNTLQLPAHVWGQAEADLARLQSLVQRGQSISFSMGNLDDALRARFPSYDQFKGEALSGEDFSNAYQSWSQTNRDTIGGTLAAAGLTAEQFATEESTMAQLRSQSQSADGQMKALQIGHQIAAQQIEQMQKLRGLVAQQMTMMGTWHQSEQAAKDLAQSRRDEFFDSAAPPTSGGQPIEPRW